MKRMLDLMMTMMGKKMKRMKSMMNLMMGKKMKRMMDLMMTMMGMMGKKMKRMLDRMMMGRSMRTLFDQQPEIFLCRVYLCQLIEMEVSDGEFATEVYHFFYLILKNS